MKPVSVTFGIEEDELAIEACFERSMMSDVGKIENSEHSRTFSEHYRFMEQRDTESERSRSIHFREMDFEERDEDAAVPEEREEGATMQPQEEAQQMAPALSPTRCAEEDEEFEMVLSYAKFRSNTFEGETSTGSREATTDEEGEEKVVVWCAEDNEHDSRSNDETLPLEESVTCDPTYQVKVANADFDRSLHDHEGHTLMVAQVLAEHHELTEEFVKERILSRPNVSGSHVKSNDKKVEQSKLSTVVEHPEEAGFVEGLSGNESISAQSTKETSPATSFVAESLEESSESLVGPSIEMIEIESEDNCSNTQNQHEVTMEEDAEKVEESASKLGGILPPSLSALIKNQDWQAVIKRVNEFTSFSGESIEEQASLLGRDSLGHSFLHEICKNQPTLEVIEFWLQTSKEDIQRPGIGGHLPIHFACSFGASLEVVDALVEAFPEALAKPDNNHVMLPLHYACREGAPVEVLDFLLVAYPEALLIQDKYGMTPIDHAVNIEDPIARQQTINSVMTGLQNNISSISEAVTTSKALLREEQAKVKEVERAARLDKELSERKLKGDRNLLEHALKRVAVLENSDKEKDKIIEGLTQKAKDLEAQLAETRLLLTNERKRLFEEKTRELESALKIEECKSSALEQSLVAKQEMVEHEQERARDMEQKYSEVRMQLQNERLKSKRLQESLNTRDEKAHEMQVDHARKLEEELGKLRKHCEGSPSDDDEISMETSRKATLEQLRQENRRLSEENEEAVRVLEQSNAKKQQLLDAQQEKVEALERVGREKEALLQKNQDIMKGLEESIQRKLALQTTEEDKIRQLDTLRHKKREMIESEEEHVRKLDYTLGRKQALLELEQMKEKTLQQTIAQKQALLEAERSTVKELESRCAEKEHLLASEQNIVKSLESSKREKERLLHAERDLVNELYRIHSEKELLLERKRKTLQEITETIDDLKVELQAEKHLRESAERVKAEKEATLRAVDQTVKSIEQEMIQKESLLAKEKQMCDSLESFHSRRLEIASKGTIYSLVDTTISISYLIKEALLARNFDQRLIEERQPKPHHAGHAKKNSIQTSSVILQKALNLKGKGYISHFAGFLGFSPSKTKILRKFP